MRRFTAERREAYLEVLRRTGNAQAAADAVGLNRSSAEQRLKRDAVFAIAFTQAKEEASRRLAGARGAFEGVEALPGQGGREFNVIKKGRGGRTQIVAAGSKRWSKATEEQFLAALRVCGNVAAVARAIGFDQSSVWHRRQRWPAFQEAMERVLDEAELNIEYRLATMGSDLAAAKLDAVEEHEERPSTASTGSGQATLGTSEGDASHSTPSAAASVEFDPGMALRFLKWREEKRRGRAPKAGNAWQRPRTMDEVRDSILRKLQAIDRHHEAQRLAEGWTRDENGHMIPPGWVRSG